MKIKMANVFMCILIFSVIFVLFQRNTLLIRAVSSEKYNFNDRNASEEEWWIEVEIMPKGDKQETNDDILLLLYDNFLSGERQNIKSWHFFREPTLRFRVELIDKENRDRIATKLNNFLNSIDLVADYYFARHGKRIEKFDEGYSGERDQYKRMWPYQKKLWEWGSEMTVNAIKEFRETGANEPSREYQLERIFHLLSNQLSPGYEMKRLEDYSLQWKVVSIIALVYAAIVQIKYLRLRKGR